MSDGEAGVRDLIARGDVLLAYDEAALLAAENPEDPALRYLAALALARAGAPQRAGLELAEIDSLGGIADGDVRLGEDVAALRARLVKDEALTQLGRVRRQTAARASSLYEAAYREFGGHFACINAASMAVVSRDAGRATALAHEARTLVVSPPSDEVDAEERYWRMATEAEAAVILSDSDGAAQALREATSLSARNFALRAATRRQLAFLCAELGVTPDLLDALPGPVVLHYTGHRFADTGGHEAGLREQIRARLDGLGADVGYGALAYGADILVAEEIVAGGGELHVVLPCSLEEFVASSVSPGGGAWIGRFDACLEAATSVQTEPSSAQPDDPSMYAFGARLAMGAAVIRAHALTGDVIQLAIWDGLESDGVAGTAADVAFWRSTARPTEVIPWDRARVPAPATTPLAVPARELRAMLFADFKDFSELNERQVVVFFEEIMGALARTIDGLGAAVQFRNSWGDGLYIVLASVQDAARCGLALQQTMARLDLADLGLPPGMGLRIGIHAGPVFSATDPVTKQATFFGTHVTRSARVEPRTPPGEVYMTGSSAALLALEPVAGVTPEYVGRLQLAKEYDVLPMYVLRHRSTH